MNRCNSAGARLGRDLGGAEWLQQPCVLLKPHKGTMAKLINFPGLAFRHMPRSYTSDRRCFAKPIE